MKKPLIFLLHAGYWFLYALIVLLIWAGGQAHHAPPHLEGTYAVSGALSVLFLTPYSLLSFWPGFLGFYTFYLLLFDRFLARKKFGKLVLWAVLTLVLIPLVLEAVLLIAFPDGNFALLAPAFGMAMVALVNGILGLVIRGFVKWYDDSRINDELNRKNQEMELALMKAQIHPHFLFNTLNNIDILIQKDAAKASGYLNELSEILRYLLYETKTGRVCLEKELLYIRRYIDLQRIRTTNPNYVHYEVKGDPGSVLVEPMLFMPFIENAFKHAHNKKVEHAIEIRFEILKDRIRFECENAYHPGPQVRPDHGGLGNDLIGRRLTLLYPGKHTYRVSDENGIYKTNLDLALS